jgi:hypothetical protein
MSLCRAGPLAAMSCSTKYTVADRPGGAVNVGLNGSNYVALFRCRAMAGEEDECEIGTRRTFFEPFHRAKKPLSVEIETAGTLPSQPISSKPCLASSSATLRASWAGLSSDANPT